MGGRPPGSPAHPRPALTERAAGPTWELVALAVGLAGVARIAEGPALWGMAILAAAALAVATLEVLGADQADDPGALGVPIEALILPAVAALGTTTALHLVPVGLLLAPGLVATGALVTAAVAVERRILARRSGPTDADRTALLSLIMLLAFVAFAGMAAAIPGALVEPLPTGDEAGPPGIPLERVTLLALLDGLVAGLLGYRLAALRGSTVRSALAAALSYVAVVAIAAAALRAMGLPRLLGPALLTLVLYLWSAYRSVPRTARRDVRWIWEVILLTALGIAVVAWNLLAPA
ncbi:MAG: hypothetical protein MUC54_07070 [Chloroflexi bacterium]|nr:hypothetical protein [Chloroflexota bacterium]